MNRIEWDRLISRAFDNFTLMKTIEERVKDFILLKYSDINQIFNELTFCTLTANTSAELGIRCVNGLRSADYESYDSIREALIKCRYRFPNTRARFIYENFKKRHFLEMIREMDEPEFRRDFISDTYIGIGYKEASHFLRNIGYFEYAILDKHILKFLEEYFQKGFKNKSRKTYLEAEGYFLELSSQYATDPGIMDLIIWYLITGKVLK